MKRLLLLLTILVLFALPALGEEEALPMEGLDDEGILEETIEARA